MHRLIWGFADCWKSHVTAQLYSFEASDAKSDINSCSDPVCLLGPRFLPRIWFGKTSEIFWIQTIFKLWKQVGEREREREREKSCNLEKYHEWVLKSFSCASAFARQSRIFDGIDALYAFSVSFKLTKHSFLNSIRIWSGSELWQRFFFFFKGERIQISLKAGHHRPASKTPFNGVSLACRWWPNVECWLGCSENFRGFDLVLLRGPVPCPPSGSAHGTGQCVHLLRYTENPFYRAHRLLYDTAYFLSHAQIFKLTKHSFLNSIRVWSGSKPFLQM